MRPVLTLALTQVDGFPLWVHSDDILSRADPVENLTMLVLESENVKFTISILRLPEPETIEVEKVIEKEVEKVVYEPRKPVEVNSDYVMGTIERIGLSDTINRNLKSAGITQLKQLVKLTREEVLKIELIGKESLKRIETALSHNNLKLKD